MGIPLRPMLFPSVLKVIWDLLTGLVQVCLQKTLEMRQSDSDGGGRSIKG